VKNDTSEQERVLTEMMGAMERAPALYKPSVFWKQLLERHIDELQRDGFENFKRTLNMKYFNWGVLGIVRHQLTPVLRAWLTKPSAQPLSAGFSGYAQAQRNGSRVKSFSTASALVYRTYVAMLADLVAASDPMNLLTRLAEPEIGNPFRVHYRGQWMSQDLCNSIHEFYSATSDLSRTTPGLRVAELGAGYGRLGQVFLSALPGASYCVIDIPPALYVSQRYLTELYPDVKTFRFREFTSFEDVRAEFEASTLRFLAAHQIELLPADAFDLFVNISSLHEMTAEQIANYLRQIDRVTRGHFYSKQWKVSRAQVNGFTIREHEYPLPATWGEVFHRQHPIQRMFFEALYRTRPTAR
jgi:putative sugar O-methyltransferase